MMASDKEKKSIRIQSRRLLLRSMLEEDITVEYVNWLNDFNTTKYLEVRFNTHTQESVQNT